MADSSQEGQISQIVRKALEPSRLLAVYNHVHPTAKGKPPSGTEAGWYRFRPSSSYMQGLYNLIYHDAILPLSKLPFEGLLELDLTQFLPETSAKDYPEQCLGMITILDQQRMLTTGYGHRYTRAFFDPIGEKLGRQLISLPNDKRPDGKAAWLARGYSFDDWLIRTLWFWGPLVHSDAFMTNDRQAVKTYLHDVRREVETHTNRTDPFASLEAADDVDLLAFTNIMKEGPPRTSYLVSTTEADVPDYAFWWIRILNSHFAITDSCANYPFWIRWKGEEFHEQGLNYMNVADAGWLEQTSEEVLREIREDFLAGTWKPLEVNPAFEK